MQVNWWSTLGWNILPQLSDTDWNVLAGICLPLLVISFGLPGKVWPWMRGLWHWGSPWRGWQPKAPLPHQDNTPLLEERLGGTFSFPLQSSPVDLESTLLHTFEEGCYRRPVGLPSWDKGSRWKILPRLQLLLALQQIPIISFLHHLTGCLLPSDNASSSVYVWPHSLIQTLRPEGLSLMSSPCPSQAEVAAQVAVL